jgi:hypothetical protein
MVTYGVTCPHCKGAIKVEISVEKLRVLASAVGGGRVKPGITDDCPLAPAPGTGANGPVCPEHGLAKVSRWGGLYCPVPNPDTGGFCKWRSDRQPATV